MTNMSVPALKARLARKQSDRERMQDIYGSSEYVLRMIGEERKLKELIKTAVEAR
jgi:hypothetical protein